jgi:LPXTG-motif cell wall-anchored protein
VIVPAGASLVIVTFTPGEGDPTPTELEFPAPSGGGTVEFSFEAPVPGLVTANFLYGDQNAYTTGCTGPGGIQAIAITRSAAGAAAAAQRLAFTGSSDTPTYVLIGIAAVVIGGVFVVAARRRSQVS